jgi:hypothetical protein
MQLISNVSLGFGANPQLCMVVASLDLALAFSCGLC